jgi:type VI secretion system protein VasJ
MTTVIQVRDPIAGPSPAGEDLSFDAAFEAVAKEIAKLESLEGARPDWRAVERESDRLLVERSKDVRLVVWSTVAKTHLRGWDGLASGLGLYLDVLPFWEAMFPPVRRLRARANLHDWMTQQVLLVLEERPTVRDDEGALTAAQAALSEIDGALELRLGELHPGSSRLRSLLRRRLEALPPPPAPVAPEPVVEVPAPVEVEASSSVPEPAREPAPSPVSEPVAEPAAAAAPAQPVLVFEPQSAADAVPTAEACLEGLLLAARLLRSEDASDARAFRLRHAVAALRFDPTEPSLEAPSSYDRERLAGLHERGELAALVEEADEAVVARPAWLDARRMLVEALGRSGAMWNGARQVVEAETMALVARAPSLVGRRFTDDTPVADAATQAWLDRERRRAVGASAIVGAEDEEAERRLAQVRELAAEGRLGEAVSLAIALANRAADGRRRFQGFLLAGTTALAAGNPAIARPLLEGLLELVQRHQLESWEPGLCVTLYASLLGCFRALGGVESSRDQDLFDRLCRLDPASAMRLSRPG